MSLACHPRMLIAGIQQKNFHAEALSRRGSRLICAVHPLIISSPGHPEPAEGVL